MKPKPISKNGIWKLFRKRRCFGCGKAGETETTLVNVSFCSSFEITTSTSICIGGLLSTLEDTVSPTGDETHSSICSSVSGRVGGYPFGQRRVGGSFVGNKGIFIIKKET